MAARFSTRCAGPPAEAARCSQRRRPGSTPAWWCACRPVGGPASAAAEGDGDRRGQRRPTWPRRHARFHDGGHAGRRGPVAARSRLCSPDRRVGAVARPLGRGRSRESGAPSNASARSSGGARDGLPFVEAMRLLAGAAFAARTRRRNRRRLVAGHRRALARRNTASTAHARGPAPSIPARPHGTLRPYQQAGRALAYLLSASALALPRRRHGPRQDHPGAGAAAGAAAGGEREPGPSLLVAPASLLANWAAEIERFAPELQALIAHPSAMPAAEIEALHRGGARPGSTW